MKETESQKAYYDLFEEWAYKPTFGAALYFRKAPDELEKLLESVLIDSGGCVAGVQMKLYDTVDTATGKTSRARKIAPSALRKAIRRHFAGSVHLISLHERRETESIDEPFIDLDFRLPVDRGPNKAQHLRIAGSPDMFKQAELTALLKDIVVSIEIDYGFILTGMRAGIGSFLDYIGGVSPLWYIDKPNPTLLIADEVRFYSDRTGEFGDMIPRANWGNILSPHHVEKLGGEERIRKESGCYLVERWGRSLYLQLTESLWKVSPEQLRVLNRYFEPIRFPGAPEPVYL